MTEQTAIHSTFVLERSFAMPPARVFAGFSDPAAKRRWFGGSHETDSFEMDFRVGGTERSELRIRNDSPVNGMLLVNDGRFLDIVPERRIVTASSMTLGGRRISASLVTFELLPTKKGTDLIGTFQTVFFEGADGPEMREAGWRALLDQLEKEVAH
jgi:uncharacterized protein YndB with AHSA1/START domain